MDHRLKRWLYVVHRWIGIATCLLFAIWFVSGLVMIYVPFPALTRTERMAGLPAIDWNLVRTSPGQALRAAGLGAPPRAFSLETRADRPVWRILPAEGAEIDIAASDGARLPEADADEANRAAAVFSHAPVTAVQRIERDQWTVAGGFDRHRPLWKVSLAGSGGRVLYVSSRTGAVVLDTTANERFWNWLGSVPHWIYPTVLRRDNAAWRQVVMWVSGPCIVAAVTGFWIGLLRTRLGRRRFRDGRRTPYRGWMEWHHWAGLIGGGALIAWIFSGWLSVDPFRLFASGGISAEARAAYAGAEAGTIPSLDLARLGAIAGGAKQVELRWTAGRPLLVVNRADADPAVFAADTLTRFRYEDGVLAAAAASLVPGARISRVERLTAPDAYWYETNGLPPLPVLRIRFDDPARTWVHIDPATGAILGDIDSRGRLYRWLFDLLHKWDLNLLTRNRPAWDILLWLFSAIGLVTSISGIRVGWARLKRRRPSSRSTAAQAAARGT